MPLFRQAVVSRGVDLICLRRRCWLGAVVSLPIFDFGLTANAPRPPILANGNLVVTRGPIANALPSHHQSRIGISSKSYLETRFD